jgi:Protein of unknown function (DUF3298)
MPRKGIRKMKTTIAIAALTGALLAGCASATGEPTSAAASTSTAAVTESACVALGGTVGPDQTCHAQSESAGYTIDIRFPVDYPDQRAIADFLKQQRDDFIEWVAPMPPTAYRGGLNIVADSYQSGTLGTKSLVFDIGRDAGVHPVTSYQAFNYDIGKDAPITFETLFKPGTKPLEVLNPIVQRELDKRGATGFVSLEELGATAYQNFAITDDAVIFFFDQDGLLPHEIGPLEVEVPRTELESLLA